jgi:hypothetical protein
MMTDPIFYAVAIPAVIMVGLSKGGFGGAMALLGVTVDGPGDPPGAGSGDSAADPDRHGRGDPVELAQTLGPKTLLIMVPGAIIGITIGWATAAWVTDAMIRLIVGIVALWFVARYVTQTCRPAQRPSGPRAHHRPVKGALWGTLAGFTSFVSHTGGPPYQIYTLPLRQDPKTYHRNQRPVFRDHQRHQACSVFRPGSVRHGQPVDIAGTGADRTGSNADRCLHRQTHEAGDLLSRSCMRWCSSPRSS